MTPTPQERLAAIESLDDVIIALDRELRITAWNVAAERLMDREAASVMGAALMPMITPGFRVDAARLFDRALAGTTIARQKFTLLRNDQSGIAVSIAIAPIHVASGPVGGLVLLGHAGTEFLAAALDAPASETILVVEDERALRATICRSLRHRGYNVLEATNGEDALMAAERYNAPIHLVVTDVVMPQMNGPDLFRTMRRWYPTMRVLFISGYTKGALPPELLEDGTGAGFLDKPFTVEQLLTEVRRMLELPRFRVPAGV